MTSYYYVVSSKLISKLSTNPLKLIRCNSCSLLGFRTNWTRLLCTGSTGGGGGEILGKHLPRKNQNSNTMRWTCVTITVALISLTVFLFLLGVAILVGVKYTASSSDADKWIKIGKENANRDLDKFDAIAAYLATTKNKNYTELHSQLFLLQQQIKDAADNNRILVPNIVGVVEKINSFLESDDPSIFSKIGLRILIWFIDGIRDNKSYYILDGAQLWCELRIKILQQFEYRSGSVDSVIEIHQLIKELNSIQTDTIGVRDQLDGMAQIFVKGVKKIHSMTNNISENLIEIKAIARELLIVSQQKTDFLENTQLLEINVDDLVKKYDDEHITTA